MEVRWHELTVNYGDTADKDGQVQLFTEAAEGLKEAAAVKRDSIDARVAKMKEIVETSPEDHFLLWHDLENERHAIRKVLPETVDIYGSMDYDIREQRVIDFSEGRTRLFATKKSLSGSGCNFQKHCHREIFLGIDYEFNDFIQAIHRCYRFLQTEHGKQFLVYDGEKVEAVTQNAYIPTLTIAKRPSSGGTAYEPLNLLSAGFTELFAGTASDTAYHLSFGGLDAKTVEVKILNSAGEWVNKKEDVDFKVDRANGIVNFTTAPGVSPLTGEDNVKITAYRTVEGYAEKINKCTIGIQYGINGALDRLFLSGNPDFVNYDWYSQQFEPSYFPDTGYSIIGTSRSKLVGYSINHSAHDVALSELMKGNWLMYYLIRHRSM